MRERRKHAETPVLMNFLFFQRATFELAKSTLQHSLISMCSRNNCHVQYGSPRRLQTDRTALYTSAAAPYAANDITCLTSAATRPIS